MPVGSRREAWRCGSNTTSPSIHAKPRPSTASSTDASQPRCTVRSAASPRPLLRRPLPRPALRLAEVLSRHPRRHGIARCCAPLSVLPSGLGGGQVEPHVRRHVILRNAFTFRIHDPEIDLGWGVPLLSSQPIPAQGFSVVLWDAAASVVHVPEIELRLAGSQPTMIPPSIPPFRAGIHGTIEAVHGPFCITACSPPRDRQGCR